jgi:transposase-like protein
MTEYQISLNGEQVKELLINDEGLKGLVETVLNQVLKDQLTEQIGAERHERSDKRSSYRNGFRPRMITCRVGKLTLRVPQTRDGSFSTDMFRRYQRSEQALVLAMMEMVLKGVSTRKVTAVTEKLCGESFSKSTVSRLCAELDLRMRAWNERPLDDKTYPFLVIDALVIKVRRDGAVRSTSALIATGVSEDGHREILGLLLGDSESEASWDDMFTWLKERGLSGVDFVVSDAHQGMQKALNRRFQGVMWQRCQVHLQRNVLGRTPRHLRGVMAEGLKKIFRSDEVAGARAAFGELVARLAGKAERAIEVLENGLDDSLTVLELPGKYRRRLRTTNMAERLNEEVRRREKVIRIFPNEASAQRLIGALLAEQHEVWFTGKRYFDMTEYFEWKEAREEKQTRKLVKVG